MYIYKQYLKRTQIVQVNLVLRRKSRNTCFLYTHNSQTELSKNLNPGRRLLKTPLIYWTLGPYRAVKLICLHVNNMPNDLGKLFFLNACMCGQGLSHIFDFQFVQSNISWNASKIQCLDLTQQQFISDWKALWKHSILDFLVICWSVHPTVHKKSNSTSSFNLCPFPSQ